MSGKIQHDDSRDEDLFYGTATVGDRGQIVIPADARRAYSIETGDKLLIMGHPLKQGLVICKVEVIREFMSHMIEKLRIVESHATDSPAAKESE
jgi:AbrB family looped-hinge helix DNA binding protein